MAWNMKWKKISKSILSQWKSLSGFFRRLYENGGYGDPFGIMVERLQWAWERVADLLPSGYRPDQAGKLNSPRKIFPRWKFPPKGLDIKSYMDLPFPGP